jgi:hypothetical protein
MDGSCIGAGAHGFVRKVIEEGRREGGREGRREKQSYRMTTQGILISKGTELMPMNLFRR